LINTRVWLPTDSSCNSSKSFVVTTLGAPAPAWLLIFSSNGTIKIAQPESQAIFQQQKDWNNPDKDYRAGIPAIKAMKH
jgi:hypothetical protein